MVLFYFKIRDKIKTKLLISYHKTISKLRLSKLLIYQDDVKILSIIKIIVKIIFKLIVKITYSVKIIIKTFKREVLKYIYYFWHYD